MNAFFNIIVGLIGGFGVWLLSNAFCASNPSINAIAYGGFLTVAIFLNDIISEIKRRNKE